MAARHERPRRPARHGACWVWPAGAVAGVYGGYFGAAQGVLLMAVLGIGVDETLQRHNATKNVLAPLVNGVAAVVFIAVADVDWRSSALIAVGSVIGGQLGATVGRRLPPPAAARGDRGGRRRRAGVFADRLTASRYGPQSTYAASQRSISSKTCLRTGSRDRVTSCGRPRCGPRHVRPSWAPTPICLTSSTMSVLVDVARPSPAGRAARRR